MSKLHEHEAPVSIGRSQPTLRRLLTYARPYLLLLGLTLVLSAMLSGARLGRAYLMKPIFDEIVMPAARIDAAGGAPDWLATLPPLEEMPRTSGDARAEPSVGEPDADPNAGLRRVQEAFWQVLFAALVIVVVTPILMFTREYAVQYMLGRIDMDMKVDVCGKILVLPMRFHHGRERGDLLQRILDDTKRAHQAISIAFGDFLEAVAMILVGFAALFYISWQLTLVMLGVGPLIMLVITGFGQRIRKSARRRQEQSADVTQRLVEILAGIKIVKAFRAEEKEHRAFGDASYRLFRRGMKVVKNRVMARSLIDAANNFAAIGVLIFGIWLVLGGHWGMTAGSLGAFVAMTATIYTPVRTFAKGWAKLLDALPSAERYFEVIDTDVEIRDADEALAIGRVAESVVFDDVTFSYGREPVLEHVSFDAKAGDVVAIVGRTGSGKTTLTDLLLRLYDPDGGRITIDGVELRRIQRNSLLDQIAVVTQEPFLFDGSVGDNIRYGRPDATDAEVEAAAKAAHVDEFVATLPEGYETLVGGGGARLSGGQRQRVTIARAILRDPSILILDEATSSLDSKAEHYVQEALEALLPGRTVFVIAHRLSTVRKADRILVLEGGRISQSGTHDDLLAAGGLYRELVEMQSQPDPTPMN